MVLSFVDVGMKGIRMKITKGQIQIIKTLQGRIGMDDEAYRSLLAKTFRVKSCTQLSYPQAGVLIEDLKRKAGQKAGGSFIKNNGNRADRRGTYKKVDVPYAADEKKVVRLASRASIDKINKLADLIEWRLENGLSAWMKKRFGIEKVKTAGEAYRVIEGLKKMFENQMKKAYGEGWRSGVYDRPEVVRYIDEHVAESAM